MTTPQLRMIAKCKEVFERAKTLYGLDLSKVAVRFDLRGRVGGRAEGRGAPRVYSVRFNYDMLLRETEEMVNVVAAHEAAHIVCFMNPKLGKNHDYGWARICKALGGTGDTKHCMEVVFGNGTTYEYTTDRGHKVRLNDRRHVLVQQGRTLTYRKGLGAVTQQCAYSIVGVRGTTLATPIVKKVVEPTVRVKDITGIPAQRPPRLLLPALVTLPQPGRSKADVARAIMITGHRAGNTVGQIIAAIMQANGHSKALATSYYKNNTEKLGLPAY